MGASTEKDARQSATLDENERRGVCQSLRDLIQHGGNMDHKDRKNLMWKAISLIETPRSETAPLVTGDLAKQREIHDTYAPVSATPCSADSKDAARYRWLRDVSNWIVDKPRTPEQERFFDYAPGALDAHIDEAMK